ncbi:hypothetical protein FFLO_04890 [Filobasidium floriforme]|uniref:Uncharacterized protein n=1 Tax=Filobasidium floriforme TaxID=5210 RepID=A0A8K0JJI1_9TREE|nr:hypothetical protein FFLO_04890 [Filobasidium floriforme]
MQADHPQAALEDFQAGIFSKDPVEYNAAINLYVEPQASYCSSLISTHGASRIKNIVALEKLFVRSIKVDKRPTSRSPGGGSKWDDNSQVYFVPTLTTYGPPFALPLVDVSFTFPTSLTLHLNMNEDDNFESVGQDEARTRSEIASSGGEEKQKTFVITKWEEKGPLDAVIGFGGKTVNKLHRSFLRPMTTLIILLLAGTRHFVHTHPLSDGIFKFIIAAIVTFVIEARDIILAELSSKHPQMVYHTDTYSKSVKRSAHSAQSSVSSAYNNLTTALPQSPASSIKNRTAGRAPFQPSSSTPATTSASTVHATGATVQKPHNLAVQDHASFAEVVKEGDAGRQDGHADKRLNDKKMGDEPHRSMASATAGMAEGANDGEGHPSYAQVVVEGDEEHHHDHPASTRAEHHHAPPSQESAQDHGEHASYAEVAAEGVVDHDN